MSINQPNELAEGRIIIAASILYLLVVEAEIIMLGGRLNSVVIGAIRLDDDFSCFKSTSGSASYLT